MDIPIINMATDVTKAIKDIASSENGMLSFYDGVTSYFGLGLRPAIQDVIFVQIKFIHNVW